MNSSYISPYELCLCGSGIKYKFCCYSNKKSIYNFHNKNEFNNYILRNKPKLSLCIHQNNDCNNIIKSHSIQNNRIISKLCLNNHVYIIDYSDNSGIAGNDFKLKGKNEASTSKSFCSFHDNMIFKPIECMDYNNTKEQNFLFAYRAFSKHYYDMTDSLNVERLIFKTIPYTYKDFPEQITYLRGLNVEVEKHNEIRDIFNLALKQQNFDIISSYVIELDYEIQFATAYMAPLSYDLECNQISDLYSLTDDMRYIFISMFPEKEKSYIIISWFTRDNNYLKKFIKQLDSYKNNTKILINILNNLIVSQTNNFVISPRLYNSWTEEKQKNFLSIYNATFLGTKDIKNIGQEIEKNLVLFPCKFDLFEKLE